VTDKPKPVPLSDFESQLDTALMTAMKDDPGNKDILAIAERRAKAKRVGNGAGSAGPGIDQEAIDILSAATEEARNAGSDSVDMSETLEENERS